MIKIIIPLFLYFTITTFSQDKKGVVFYGQKESMGMGAPIGVDYTSVLVFNNNESIYITRNDSIEKKRVHEQKVFKDKNNVHIVTKATNKYGFRYYTNFIKDSLFSRDIGFTYIKEKKPKINWIITEETKKIGSYLCIKATTEFRGRNYSAWYTPEIAVKYGPWKLQGLPGLILEAYDTKKEVYFYFKSFKYPGTTSVTINKPVNQSHKKWINLKEYRKFLINAYLNSINSGRVFAESFNSLDTELNTKYSLNNSFIENFNISEFYDKKK
ncbi:GLPGLI family protein [Tenacibaculum insulae]|uniref:GLPGLI family protein n=1 Tax=Tenacibaculum insulae TaxID=2029677 RepID=UPI003AB640BF